MSFNYSKINVHPCAYNISLGWTGCIRELHDARVQSGPERLAQVNSASEPSSAPRSVDAPPRGRTRPAWPVGGGPWECALGKGSAARGALSVTRPAWLPRPRPIQAAERAPPRSAPRLRPRRRPCQGAGVGAARPACGPDGGPAPRGDTFSGFQKEHFLSCLIFSSFKCKWRGFAPRLA